MSIHEKPQGLDAAFSGDPSGGVIRPLTDKSVIEGGLLYNITSFLERSGISIDLQKLSRFYAVTYNKSADYTLIAASSPLAIPAAEADKIIVVDVNRRKGIGGIIVVEYLKNNGSNEAQVVLHHSKKEFAHNSERRLQVAETLAQTLYGTGIPLADN